MKDNIILTDIQKVTNSIRVILMVILVAFIGNMSFPQSITAAQIVLPLSDIQKNQEPVIKSTAPADLLAQRFIDYKDSPNIPKQPEVARVMTVVATAYSSTVDQCDSTPCIAADGFNVCKHNKEDIIAANFLKFGTKVRIPDIYGDRIFVVHDRMNPKYNERIDLWKTSRESAIAFGKRTIRIEILN
ncbi:3D domain-containing protein [Patescibacteria group bacterium]|nr:3D domain-containing protein [Patescibacteria group bacterium]